ncbi:MAG: SagB/ThcOx family dehydrogenase, partial [Saccharothrix sp.]|nr:SagB/ThcOx family dehydrogenase [Saccharothrix sp.]
VAAMTAAVTELDGAGVRWVVGTDTPNPGLRAGASMWEEMNLLVAAGLDRSRVYRSAAVCPGVGERGDDSLVLLPLSTFDTESFPVAPPHAVLLRGCLFLTTRPSTEVTMPISYRRDPWLCIEWDEGDRVAVVNSRSRRRFRVQPDLLRMLNAMSQPTSPDHLELPGYSAEQLDDLLGRLRDAGLVQTVNGHDEVIASEWTASELAVHAQAARGGKPRVRKRDIPPARLRHQQVLATVELPESLPYSRPLAEVLRDRRSIRDFAAEPLTLRQLATFLDRAARVRGWLGPDVWQTTRRPSASGGGRHSLELYLVVRDVDGLEAGAYHYDPFDHVLHRLQPWGAELDALQRRLLCQPMTVDTPPPVGFYLASCYRRVQCKYGDMTLSVIYRDTGCLLQTLYLVATDLRLAPCATAAIETKPSPAFLAEHRDSLLHTANFALGVPAASEPTRVEFRPLTETGQ